MTPNHHIVIEAPDTLSRTVYGFRVELKTASYNPNRVQLDVQLLIISEEARDSRRHRVWRVERRTQFIQNTDDHRDLYWRRWADTTNCFSASDVRGARGEVPAPHIPREVAALLEHDFPIYAKVAVSQSKPERA